VLLDATADLNGLVALNEAIEEVKVPEVSYENLTVLHLQQPKQFKRIAEVTKSAAQARPYAEWMKSIVLANTQPGDDVLVVTHLAMLAHQYLPDAGDATKPVDWDGRKVNTLHWGGPWIGLNDFKNKTHVFCFSEFYQKRSTTIAQAHGWSGRPLDQDTLKLAEGRRVQGDEFAPTGMYRSAFEGHLLRWTKQLAMRGRARAVDRNAKAAPMVLVTSMDKGRLARNFNRMFPKAAPFGQANDPSRESTLIQEASIGTVCSRENALIQEASTGTGRSGESTLIQEASIGTVCSRGFAGLVQLVETTPLAILGADVVEAVTGIQQRNLKRAVESPAVAPIVALHGFRLVDAKDIGKGGRMKYLVNDRRLVDAQVAAAKANGKTSLGALLRAR
jgi:hypothetical protein